MAIQHILSASKNLNGIWKRENERYKTGAFGFRITDTEIKHTSINFKGNFSGSVFSNKSSKEIASGSIVGTTISISNSDCSLAAKFDGKGSFIGQMTGTLMFGGMGGNNSVEVEIFLH